MQAICSSEQYTAYPSRSGIVILPTASAASDGSNSNRVITSVGATALRPSHQIQPTESYPSESNNLFVVFSSHADQFFVSTQQTEVRVGRLRYLAPAVKRRPQPASAVMQGAAAAASSAASSPMARRATSWTVDLSDNEGSKKSGGAEPDVAEPLDAATDALPTLTTTKSTLDVTIKRTHPGGKVTALAVSPCGRYVASGAQDHNVVVWSCTPPAHTNFSVFKEHTATVTAIAFGSGFLAKRTTTPARRLMASGSSDGVVLVWDVVEQTVLHYLRQAARICFVAFMHPGDEVLAVNARAAPIMFYALDARSEDEIAAAAAADGAKAESALKLAQRGVCLAQRDTPFRLPPLCFGATSSDEPIAANQLLLLRDPPPLSAAGGCATTFSVIVAREDGAAWRIKIPERLSAIRSYDEARKIASTNLRTIQLGAAFRHDAREQPPRNAAERPQPKHNVIVLRPPPPASGAARPQSAQAFCCDVLLGAHAASSLIGVRVADRVAICRYDDGTRLGVITDIGVGSIFAFCGVGDGESDGSGTQLPHPVVGKARDMQAVATIGYAVVRCGRGFLTFYSLHEKEVAEIHVIAGVVNSRGELEDDEQQQARGGAGSHRSRAMQRERVAAMSQRRWLLAVTRPGDVSLFLTDQLAGRTRPRQAAVLHLGREAAAPIAAVTSLAQFRHASAAVQRVRALAFLSEPLSDDAVGEAPPVPSSCSLFAAVVTEEDAEAEADVADGPLSATASTWVFLCAIIATATGCSMRPLARMRLPGTTDGGVPNDVAQSVSLTHEEGGEGDDGGQLRVRFVFSEVDVMLDGLLDGDDHDHDDEGCGVHKNAKPPRKPAPLQRDADGNSYRELRLPLASTAWEPVLARTRPETYGAVLRAFGEVRECKLSSLSRCHTFCTELLHAGGSGGIASLCRHAFACAAGFSSSPRSFDETAKEVARALQLRAAAVAMRTVLPEGGGTSSSCFVARSNARWRRAVERACSGSSAPAAEEEEPRAELPHVTTETLGAASRRLVSLVSLAPALLRVAPVWCRPGGTGGSAVDAADTMLVHASAHAMAHAASHAPTTPASTAPPVEVLVAYAMRLLDAAYEVERHLFALDRTIFNAAEFNDFWQPCLAASNAAVRELATVHVAEACCAERTAIVRDLLRASGSVGDDAVDARMLARLTAAASRRKGEAVRVEIVIVDGRPMKRIWRRRQQVAAAAVVAAENDNDDQGGSESAAVAAAAQSTPADEQSEDVEVQALLAREQFAALFEHQFEVFLLLASQDMKMAALVAMQRRFALAWHQRFWLPPGDHPALTRSGNGSGITPIRESSIVSRSWLHAPPPLDIESITVAPDDDDGDDDDALPHCRFGGIWRRCTVKRRVGVVGEASKWTSEQPALLHAFAASSAAECAAFALEKQLRALCHAVDGVEQVLCECTLTQTELFGLDPFDTMAGSSAQPLYMCIVVAAPAIGVGSAPVALPAADMPVAMQRLRGTLRHAFDCWARWLSRGASDQTLPLHFIAASKWEVCALSASKLLRPAAADFSRAFAVSTAGGAARISLVDVVSVAFCADALDAIEKCFTSTPAAAAAASYSYGLSSRAVDTFRLAASASSSSSLEALMQLATLRAHRNDRRFAAAVNSTLTLVPDAAELTDDVLEMRLHERHFERAAGTFEGALACAVDFYNSFLHVCERNRRD